MQGTKITEHQIEQTSGETVAENEDLSAEILIHLPATSLAQCLWVSKLWLSFICNPTFVRRHTLVHPPTFSGLFLIPRQPSQSQKVHYTALNHSKPSPPFVQFLNSRAHQIVHSCNGLLICHSAEQSEYYVSNPTTRQMRVLPSCSYMENEFALNLVFDPLTSPTYKVVCVHKVQNSQEIYKIAVYSSENRLWSVSEEPVFAPEDTDFKEGVSCNDAIHWLKNTISGLYLDLYTMLLREMPELPRRDEVSQYKFKYFGKSQGCLFYAISRPLLHNFELYQMKEDYSGWDLKYRLNLNVLIIKFPTMARHFGFHPLFSEYEFDILSINRQAEGSEEDMEMVLSVPGELIIFGLKKRTLEVIPDPVFRPSDVTIWYKVYSVYEYFETLSLV